ncbi:MAG: YfaP family protein, partial [Deltaproteobacteria bacterium]|nr:YfaP family protein [Deltaproteobacteria bacterium]
GIRIDEDACSATQLPGQRGDVEVALHWTNYNDLDLHVIDPQGEKIYYAHRTSASGGELDVDANAGCAGHRTQNAWEHIVWVSNPPSGQYQVQVNYFAHCEGAPQENSFEVTLRIDGDETVYTGSISTKGETVDVITFEY